MKKFIVAIGILLLGGLIWYLFLKSYDYKVTFKAKANVGAVNQTIKTWNITLDDGKIESTEGIDALNQTLGFADSTHIYHWKLSVLNDSLTKIQVYAKDKDHSFMNKLKIPFKDTDFEKRTRKTLLDFHSKLKEHIGKIRITMAGKDVFGPTYCAYVEVSTTQFGKAQGMMNNFPLLSNFLVNNKVKLNGLPFIEVTSWDKVTDSLKYNFCYPIIASDSLPEHPLLKYKELKAKPALKAIYNGNYITSDRAWYALLNQAEKTKQEVTGLPIEVFHNNPNMGGDELLWKAEVYLPLKEDSDE
ncbi:AraC family transcriptional regulator [Muriicola sp. Z0-33]|uniref:AraC family transcriptional regulator n=1 Tax=Muriicola sp. Z0-33 TaxID=2816957 RepID=UPI0022375B8E|nr:AraC family transcriptional regulator [Muriicola sp. Z0-33]MCW5515068.1 AraC family transcriptional regulator [Muriicola sp. Z0-33]